MARGRKRRSGRHPNSTHHRVHAHTRKMKSGKTTRVKGHRRKHPGRRKAAA